MSNSQTGALDATDIEIAARIEAARNEKGFTQEALSEETGISYPSLRRSLKGTRSLTFLEFGKIASALGVNRSELLTRELTGQESKAA